MKTFTRRDFLSTTTKGAAAASLLSASLLEAIACTNRMGPNEKVRAALIGCNGVGWDDLTAALKTPGIEFVSLCDVDQNVMLKRSARLKSNCIVEHCHVRSIASLILISILGP